MVKIKGYSDRSNYLGITFSCSMFLNNMKHQTTPPEPQFGGNEKIQYSLWQLLDSPQYLCCICCISTQYRKEIGTGSKWNLELTEPESSDSKSSALQECPGMLSNAQDTRDKQQKCRQLPSQLGMCGCLWWVCQPPTDCCNPTARVTKPCWQGHSSQWEWLDLILELGIFSPTEGRKNWGNSGSLVALLGGLGVPSEKGRNDIMPYP